MYGGGVIDLHSHLLPGVDDGAADVAESLAGLSSFRDEGVSALVVTPHFEASLQLRPAEFAARIESIDRAWAALAPVASDCGLTVFRGVELRLDMASPDARDARLRLAGGPFVLCEFAWFTIPPRSDRVIATLRRDGWTPVIAHPERYSGMDEDQDVVDRWIDAGAYLQVNGGSLLGRYGETARAVAANLLRSGRVHFVASDFHARGAPRVREYRSALARHVGEAGATMLTVTNPARLLRGEPPEPVVVGQGPEGVRAPQRERRDVAGSGSASERP